MKIAVLTSGGVDSAVALKKLQEQGHDVTAFYLKIWLEDELSYLGNCPWEEDLGYVRAICEQSKIPLQIVSMQKEYWDEVVAYTLHEVKNGRTPNPDIFCNKCVKFGKFYDKIDNSFEKIATGHYAQVEEKNGLFYLKKAPDPIKDQTYFLSHLSQAQLKKAIFPIGDLSKKEVRALAKKYNLPNQARQDSQGICFLGKIKFSEFLKHHLGEQKGDIIEFETNKKIGEHPGFWYFTIGQRHGLGLSGGPWFVVKKDTQKNQIYISKEYFTDDKPRDLFKVDSINWTTDCPTQIDHPYELEVKVRHGENFYPATLNLSDKVSGTVQIKGKDQGFASGQFAVFYEGDYCLGGGVITD